MATPPSLPQLRNREASFSSITEAFPLLRTARVDGISDDTSRERHAVLWELMSTYLGAEKRTILRQIANHVEYTLAGTRFNFDKPKAYLAVAHSIRDRLLESFNDTNQFFDEMDVKRVYYLSLEFLMGRSMQNALLNMDLDAAYAESLREIGFTLEELYEEEKDAGLGNGGLGRLAACFLDSMATLDLPAWGYGIRYNYGIFKQKIVDGYQVEVPDYWLTFGNPWEVERVDVVYPVRYYGHVEEEEVGGGEGGGEGGGGEVRRRWKGGEVVVAVAYDNPIPGYDTWNTINLRLWRSAPAREFDLSSFNAGDYMRAVHARQRAETISHVLYPADNTPEGKELRLKQQYFFVSATVQDCLRRFLKRKREWAELPAKMAMQLNDTHPAIAIPELMRVLMDDYGLRWEDAWEHTRGVCSYTNHTILPEALERWSVELLGKLLPRHLEIIYEINWRFLESVRVAYPGDADRLARLSIIEERPVKSVRMAHLAIVGSHAVNGVAQLHTDLLVERVFPEFHELFPGLFQNKTNGVTPRRWINQANPQLAALISERLGGSTAWLKDLMQLQTLREFAEDEETQAEWRRIKLQNKQRLAEWVRREVGVELPVEGALFEVQVKRIHEYKRQLMLALHCIHRYRMLKLMTPEERSRVVPRVTLIGGKAAPGYVLAKRIIKLISCISDRVNNDPEVDGLLKVVFLPNYCVSLAEKIIPAAELHCQISTAGMEASGTSNMKFMANGALLIGTMDGANIEMAEEAGEENMFIFGALTPEVHDVRAAKHSGAAEEPPCPELAAVLADIEAGEYGVEEDVRPVLDSISWENDYYLVRHDFPAFLEAQARVDACYRDQREWTRRSILNSAAAGKFSTDRTIRQYAEEIWGVSACRRPAPSLVGGMRGRTRSFPNFDPTSLGKDIAAEEDTPLLDDAAIGAKPVTEESVPGIETPK